MPVDRNSLHRIFYFFLRLEAHDEISCYQRLLFIVQQQFRDKKILERINI